MTRTYGILKAGTLWAVLFSMIFYSSAVFAATIHVPADYPTIQAGIDAAVNGDTVVVAPGTYTENISFTDKELRIISSDGPEVTIIDGDGGDAFNVSNGGELRGFFVTNSTTAIRAGGPSLKIVKCYLHRNVTGILGATAEESQIINCLITQNQTGCQLDTNWMIINSTLADNNIDVQHTPGWITRREVRIGNSILGGQLIAGAHNPIYLEYCNYDPSKVSTEVIVKEGCQTANPLFVDQINSDYRLQVGSPCVNAGDPNAFYNDSDGSQNDMGYTGGSDIFVNAGSLEFAYVAVGRTKELPLIIYNNTDTEITLNAFYVGSSDLSTSARFPLGVSAHSHQSIPINYSPTASGPFDSTVQINSDGLHGASSAIFPITGYGVAYTGGVIHVPSEAPTIQAAVDVCAPKDTILIAPGTYHENIRLYEKLPIIQGEYGAENTIIDGDGGQAFCMSVFDSGGGERILRGLSITNCNVAVDAGGNDSVPSVKIQDCLIYRNNVGLQSGFTVNIEITNCVIAQNHTGFHHVYYGEDAFITNSTFADNVEDVIFDPGWVSGLKLSIVNSILRGQITGNSANAVSLDYCNYDPTKLGTNVTVQDGCQTGDPLFVDMINGNYRLQPESPCIDAGTSAGAPGDDIEGVTRPQGAGYDMGAYEFGGTPNVSPTADAGPDQIVFNKVTLDGSGSSDPDGSIVAYEWQLNHRTNPAFNRTATGIKPTVLNLKKGYYDVTLTVTDDQAATDTDTMELAVAGNRVVVVPLY